MHIAGIWFLRRARPCPFQCCSWSAHAVDPPKGCIRTAVHRKRMRGTPPGPMRPMGTAAYGGKGQGKGKGRGKVRARRKRKVKGW